MRLIFNKERQFLNNKLGINIPEETAFMDKMNIKVLDNEGNWYIIYKIQAKDMQLKLKKDNSSTIKDKQIIPWKDIIEDQEEHLKQIENESMLTIKKYILNYDDYEILTPISGGKDSAITYYLVQHTIKDYNIDKETKVIFSNTTNETHHTYKYVKNNYDNLNIITPKEGFYQLVKKYGTVPSRFNRFCCSMLKEAPMIQQLDKDKKLLFFMGMRKAESLKRSEYETEWKNIRWNTDTWQGILPILGWTELDIWLYMLYKNVPINEIYELGFARCGCTNCPYRSDYELILNKEFLPTYHDRWQQILKDDFIIHKKSPSLNCSLQEYQNGAWKAGIVRDEATEEIKQEFSQLTGIDRKISDKYFDKKCMCCDKKLKKDDIGLSMKYYGRQIEKFKCINCLAEELGIKRKDLKNKIKEFKNQGCDLF